MTLSPPIRPLIILSVIIGPLLPLNAEDDLAAKAQNPIASMISVPLDTSVDFGADNGTAVITNFQPVIPITVGEWNLVNRPILPIVYLEGAIAGTPGIPESVDINSQEETFGLGDLNYSVYASPAKASDIIWGIGPSVSFPTATDDLLGTGKWSLGPTAVILTQPKPWSLGILVRQLWDIGGDSGRSQVNQFLVQPFVNYNLDNGWYLNFDPIMTANWQAEEKWTVPLGLGIGKLTKFGNQPVNLRLRGYYNVVKPTGAPEWSLHFAVQLLFPK
jgi:hypothetical protein